MRVWSARLVVAMHPFAMEMAAILVHSLNRFFIVAAMEVAELLLCCDIIIMQMCTLYTGVVSVNLSFHSQARKGSCSLQDFCNCLHYWPFTPPYKPSGRSRGGVYQQLWYLLVCPLQQRNPQQLWYQPTTGN